MSAYGAIDLFSGSSSVAGSNLFQTDKDPLNELYEGVEDIIGKQATSAGGQVTGVAQAIVNAILGIPLDILDAIEGAGDLLGVNQFFGNIESFLGNIDFNLGDFDPVAAFEDFVNTMLNPSQWGQNLKDFLGSDLTDDLFNVATAAENFIVNILNPTGLIAEWGELWTELTGDVGGGVADIANFMNQGVQGLEQVGQVLAGEAVTAINGAVEDVQKFFGGYSTTQTQVATNTVKSQNYTMSVQTGGYRNPAWVSRYPIGDVTFPEDRNLYIYTIGTTGAQSAGTAHTHDVNIGGSSAAFQVAQTESIGSYLTTTNTTIYDTVGVGVAKNTSGSINNAFLEVFQEMPDGSLVQVFSKNIASALTTTYLYHEETLPMPIIAQAGERWLVRIRNASTATNTVGIVGVVQAAAITPNVSFDTGLNSTLTNQTSYTAAEATTARGSGIGGIVMWAALSAVNIEMTDRVYADNFNRSALGGQWLGVSTGVSNLDIQQVGDSGALAYTGTTSGDQTSLYIFSVTSDACKVEAQLTIDPLATTQEEGLIIHAARDFSQVVYLGVTNTTATIYSGSASSLTSRESITLTGVASGLWAIYYDAISDKYVVLKDGVVTGLEWTGVGSTVSHGAGFQFGGARISCSGAQPAGTIEDWSLQDFIAAVSASVVMSRAAATSATSAPTVTVLNEQTTAGAWTYTVPAWCNTVDLAGIGGGGGGGGSGGFDWGGGGNGGVFTSRTLVRGVDFAGSLTITGTVGAAGAIAGGGAATTIVIPGVGTLTGAGGTTGGTNNNGPDGTSSGNLTLNGFVYPGSIGGTHGDGSSANAAAGSGGGGANTFSSNNKAGRAGAIWVRVRV